MVVAAGRDEGGLRAVALHQREAEHAAVEAERAIEIGDLQVYVADAGAGGNRPSVGLRRWERFQHERPREVTGPLNV